MNESKHMNWSEAIQVALNGNKIRRESWSNLEYYCYYNHVKTEILDLNGNCIAIIDNMLAIDWVIYEAPRIKTPIDEFIECAKRIKETVNQSLDQFINKYELK